MSMAEILFYDVRQKSRRPSWREKAPKEEEDAVKISLLEKKKKENVQKGCCVRARLCRIFNEADFI